jgi:serine-type D-Ala-D-Ala carboxypeptidase/endopeptidase (penicillin-binding protein 4)
MLRLREKTLQINRYVWYQVICYTVAWTSFFYPIQSNSNNLFAKELPKKIIGLDALQKELDEIFQKRSPNNFFWGIRIESLDKNQVIYSLNAGKNFTPASNQKLVTVGAALNYLDTTFRYSTTVAMQGKVQNAKQTGRTLKGNLIVKSNGDPSISEKWQNGNATQFFEVVADSLLKLGISEIEGDIIGDDSAFMVSDVAMDFCGGDGDYAGSWEWEDMSYAMASPASALSFNENMVRVEAYPAQKPGKAPLVITTFPTGYISIINRAITGARKAERTIRITRQLGTNNVLVTGILPIGSSKLSEPIAIERPAIFFLTVLKETLVKKGISVTGKVRRKGSKEVLLDGSLTLIARYTSPQLKQILEYINKESNNFSAEQVLRTMGKAVRNQASREAGLEVLQAYLVSLGVGQNAFYLKDASGLSRQNMLSPVALVAVLKSLYRPRVFSTFLNTLSIAGVDGTLKKRLVGTAAQGVVYGKTGYIAGVRTFSGYVKTAGGEWVAVSIMAMNYTQPTSEVEAFQDQALLLLANWKQK